MEKEINGFEKLVAARHSTRGYETREVAKADLDYILRCALAAPSACNRQPWHIYVATTGAAREAMNAAYPGREWFAQAPVCLLVCADDSKAWVRSCDGHPHGDVDAAILAEHICLAASDRGLGTCWVCNFDMPALRESLQLPYRPVAMIPLGYEAPGGSKPSTRRPASETVTYL